MLFETTAEVKIKQWRDRTCVIRMSVLHNVFGVNVYAKNTFWPLLSWCKLNAPRTSDESILGLEDENRSLASIVLFYLASIRVGGFQLVCMHVM